jgi:hypothetical protein
MVHASLMLVSNQRRSLGQTQAQVAAQIKVDQHNIHLGRSGGAKKRGRA